MRLIAGLVVALFAGICFSYSYVGQHGVAANLAPFDLRRPIANLRQLVTSMRWMVAWLSGWLGWGLYVAALALAPLSLVQAVTAGGIGLLALVSHFLTRPLRALERRAAYLATLGLVLIALSVRTNGYSHTASLHLLELTVLGGLGIASLCVLASRRTGLALASGICYGVGDVATKGALSGAPVLIAFVIVAYVAGFATLQLAFQRSSLLVSGGLSFLLSNVIPLVSGVALFGERPLDPVLAGLRYLGFVVVIVGAVAIAATAGAHESS